MTTTVSLYNTQKHNYTSEEGPSLTEYVGIDYAKCMSQNDTHVHGLPLETYSSQSVL